MHTIPVSTGGLLREKQVLKLIPVARSTLWDWVKNGKFPAPIKLSEKVSVWGQDQINTWVAAKLAGGK